MPTRIGVIADVHADLDRLCAALALLEERGAQAIVCLGDLVEKGMDGDAVVRLLRARQIPCVRGNHDLTAPGNVRWLRENAIPGHPMLLDDRTLVWLASLPRALTFEWEGNSVLLAHGTPSSEHTYLRHTNPRDFIRRALDGVRADVILLGHTHQPMRLRVGSTWVFNPGSVMVGLNGDIMASGSGTCGLLTLPDRAFDVYAVDTGRLVDGVPMVQVE
jgi:putative phosphoesterase